MSPIYEKCQQHNFVNKLHLITLGPLEKFLQFTKILSSDPGYIFLFRWLTLDIKLLVNESWW